MTTEQAPPQMQQPWGDYQPLVARIIVQGTLELLTPTGLGSGDSDGLLDMLLLRDAVEQRPLLPGTSIAGALRGYLLLRQRGYRVAEDQHAVSARLFGGTKGDDEGTQSLLLVDDALAQQQPSVIRDGVRIAPQTRTAQDQKKFDYELLPAGTTFPLRLELRIPAAGDEAALTQALALALQGFERQEIRLGIRKRRGFGQCVVRHWEVARYAMQEPAELLAWLATGLTGSVAGIQPVATRTDTHISTALGVSHPPETDARQHATLTATFALASPLLIRSTEPLGTADQQPDVAHLRSNGHPILPGTSLAGALRARAQRILHTLAGKTDTPALLDSLFGHDMDQRPEKHSASRLRVDEVAITKPGDYLVQQRVSIDRFTGGPYTAALFSEAPLTSGTVTIKLHVQSAAADDEEADYPAEVGLLLLLLKDLWTSDLPLGGTSSIGRGRLQGLHATLESTLPACEGKWSFAKTEETEDGLQVSGDSTLLQAYVDRLVTKMQPMEQQQEEEPHAPHP